MDTDYPGGMIGNVPLAGATNVAFVEASNNSAFTAICDVCEDAVPASEIIRARLTDWPDHAPIDEWVHVCRGCYEAGIEHGACAPA